jgi:Signal transduction histidine kinase
VAQEVDLIALAEAALRIHHRRITAQKIHLVRDSSKGTSAEIYAGEILQVVSNLLANALTLCRKAERSRCGCGNEILMCNYLLQTMDRVWHPIMWHVFSNRSSQRKRRKRTEAQG